MPPEPQKVEVTAFTVGAAGEELTVNVEDPDPSALVTITFPVVPFDGTTAEIDVELFTV